MRKWIAALLCMVLLLETVPAVFAESVADMFEDVPVEVEEWEEVRSEEEIWGDAVNAPYYTGAEEPDEAEPVDGPVEAVEEAVEDVPEMIESAEEEITEVIDEVIEPSAEDFAVEMHSEYEFNAETGEFVQDLVLAKGDTFAMADLAAQYLNGPCVYTSDAPAIAKVSDMGVIKAVTTGITRVQAAALNGDTVTMNVMVVAAVSGVTVRADHKTIGVGESLQLETIAKPIAEITTKFAYSSSNKSVASVTADGVVTGLKAGSATITVKAYNGKKSTIKLTVKKAPTQLTIAAPYTELGVGETTMAKLTYGKNEGGGTRIFSTDETVASVETDGTVTANDVGTALIIVKTYNGLEERLFMRVKKAPEYVFSDPEEIVLAKSDKRTLVPYVDAASRCHAYTYETSNKKIAKVSTAGVVTGAAAGTCTIRVTAYNGVYTDVPVTVKGAVSKLTVTSPYSTIGVGQSTALNVAFTPADLEANCTFTSSSKKVATVTADGIVTGVKAGTATITVKSYNGKKATFKIRVQNDSVDMPGISDGPVYHDYSIMADQDSTVEFGSVITISAVKDGEPIQIAGVFSKDKNILKPVSSTQLKAVGAGTCAVYAICEDGTRTMELSFKVKDMDPALVTAAPTAAPPELSFVAIAVSTDKAFVGDTVSCTAGVAGAQGKIKYSWMVMADNALIDTMTTDEDTIKYELKAPGKYEFRCSAEDTSGASAALASEIITVSYKPVAAIGIRALLTGGTVLPDDSVTWEYSVEEGGAPFNYSITLMKNGREYKKTTNVSNNRTETYRSPALAGGSVWSLKVVCTEAGGTSCTMVSDDVSVASVESVTPPAPELIFGGDCVALSKTEAGAPKLFNGDIIIRWNGADNADSYNVKLERKNGSTWVQDSLKEGITDNSAQFPGSYFDRDYRAVYRLTVWGTGLRTGSASVYYFVNGPVEKSNDILVNNAKEIKMTRTAITGITREFPVASDYPWTASASAAWIHCEQPDENTLRITLDDNFNGNGIRTGTVTLNNGKTTASVSVKQNNISIAPELNCSRDPSNPTVLSHTIQYFDVTNKSPYTTIRYYDAATGELKKEWGMTGSKLVLYLDDWAKDGATYRMRAYASSENARDSSEEPADSRLYTDYYFKVSSALDYVDVDGQTALKRSIDTTLNFKVHSTGYFKVESDAAWLTMDGNVSSLSAYNYKSITCTAAALSGTAARTAHITVTSGTKKAVLTVVQGGSVTNANYLTVCENNMTLTDSSCNVMKSKGSLRFKAYTVQDWTASTDVNWITLSSTSGSSDQLMVVNYTENTGAVRTGHITFQSGTLKKTITIKQNGAVLPKPVVTVVPSLSFDANKPSTIEPQDIHLSWPSISGARYYVVRIIENSTSWGYKFEVDGTGSTQSFTIPREMLHVGSNEYTIMVQAVDAYGDSSFQSIDFYISAKGANIYSSRTPEWTNVTDMGTQREFEVYSTANWTAKSNSSWITLGTTSGSNGGTLRVITKENTGAARTGTVTITCDGVNTTLTVKQLAYMKEEFPSLISPAISEDVSVPTLLATGTTSLTLKWNNEPQAEYYSLSISEMISNSVAEVLWDTGKLQNANGTYTFNSLQLEKGKVYCLKLHRRCDRWFRTARAYYFMVTDPQAYVKVNGEQRETMQVNGTGGYDQFDVESSGVWTAVSDSDWIMVRGRKMNLTEGQSSSDYMSYTGMPGTELWLTVLENTGAARNGNVTVHCAGKTAVIRVEQNRKQTFAKITNAYSHSALTPSSQAFGAVTLNWSAASGCTGYYRILVYERDESGHYTNVHKKGGLTGLSYTIPQSVFRENNTYRIYLQTIADDTIDIDDNPVDGVYVYMMYKNNVNVSAGADWGNAWVGDMVKVDAAGYGGSGNYQYEYSLLKDGTRIEGTSLIKERYYTFTLRSEGTYQVRVAVKDTTTGQTASVTTNEQSVKPAETGSISIDREAWSVEKNGGSISVNVQSSSAYTVRVSDKWLHTAKNGNITEISADMNGTGAARTGYVTFEISDSIRAVLTVNQDSRNAAADTGIGTIFTGALGKASYTIHVGERVKVGGYVSGEGLALDRITLQVEGYAPTPDYTYATIVNDTLTYLDNYDEFMIDATREPLNNPGNYVIKLYASNLIGEYAEVDRAVVTVVKEESIETGTVSFEMDRTKALTGEAVSFRVFAPGASEVMFVADGNDIETWAVPAGGMVLIDRAFSSAGLRSISFKAKCNGAWTEPCAAQPILITSPNGTLPKAVPELENAAVVGRDAYIGWKAVPGAEYYNIYLYRCGEECMRDTVRSNGSSVRYRLDSGLLSQEGTYVLNVLSVGSGYKQSEGSIEFHADLPRVNGKIEITNIQDGQIIFSNSCTVKWNSVDGAQKYAVSVRDTTTNEVLPGYPKHMNSLSETFAVEPWHTYHVWVCAIADVSDRYDAPGNDCDQIDISCYTIPEFRMGVLFSRIKGDDVRVVWDEPAWPEGSVPPEGAVRYNVWWYGPDGRAIRCDSFTGSDEAAVLSGSDMTASGNYGAEVYAFFNSIGADDGKVRLAGGITTFNVEDPKVTIVTPTDTDGKNHYMPSDGIGAQLEFKGGIRYITSELFDANGNHVELLGDGGFVQAVTQAITENAYYSEIRPAVNLTSDQQYRLQVNGFLSEEAIQHGDIADSASVRIYIDGSRVFTVSINSNNAYIYSDSTLKVESETNALTQAMELRINGQHIASLESESNYYSASRKQNVNKFIWSGAAKSYLKCGENTIQLGSCTPKTVYMLEKIDPEQAIYLSGEVNVTSAPGGGSIKYTAHNLKAYKTAKCGDYIRVRVPVQVAIDPDDAESEVKTIEYTGYVRSDSATDLAPGQDYPSIQLPIGPVLSPVNWNVEIMGQDSSGNRINGYTSDGQPAWIKLSCDQEIADDQYILFALDMTGYTRIGNINNKTSVRVQPRVDSTKLKDGTTDTFMYLVISSRSYLEHINEIESGINIDEASADCKYFGVRTVKDAEFREWAANFVRSYRNLYLWLNSNNEFEKTTDYSYHEGTWSYQNNKYGFFNDQITIDHAYYHPYYSMAKAWTGVLKGKLKEIFAPTEYWNPDQELRNEMYREIITRYLHNDIDLNEDSYLLSARKQMAVTDMGVDIMKLATQVTKTVVDYFIAESDKITSIQEDYNKLVKSEEGKGKNFKDCAIEALRDSCIKNIQSGIDEMMDIYGKEIKNITLNTMNLDMTNAFMAAYDSANETVRETLINTYLGKRIGNGDTYEYEQVVEGVDGALNSEYAQVVKSMLQVMDSNQYKNGLHNSAKQTAQAMGITFADIMTDEEVRAVAAHLIAEKCINIVIDTIAEGFLEYFTSDLLGDMDSKLGKKLRDAGIDRAKELLKELKKRSESAVEHAFDYADKKEKESRKAGRGDLDAQLYIGHVLIGFSEDFERQWRGCTKGEPEEGKPEVIDSYSIPELAVIKLFMVAYDVFVVNSEQREIETEIEFFENVHNNAGTTFFLDFNVNDGGILLNAAIRMFLKQIPKGLGDALIAELPKTIPHYAEGVGLIKALGEAFAEYDLSSISNKKKEEEKFVEALAKMVVWIYAVKTDDKDHGDAFGDALIRAIAKWGPENWTEAFLEIFKSADKPLEIMTDALVNGLKDRVKAYSKLDKMELHPDSFFTVETLNKKSGMVEKVNERIDEYAENAATLTAVLKIFDDAVGVGERLEKAIEDGVKLSKMDMDYGFEMINTCYTISWPRESSLRLGTYLPDYDQGGQLSVYQTEEEIRDPMQSDIRAIQQEIDLIFDQIRQDQVGMYYYGLLYGFYKKGSDLPKELYDVIISWDSYNTRKKKMKDFYDKYSAEYEQKKKLL